MNLQVGNLVKYLSVDSRNQNHIGIGIVAFADEKGFYVSWLSVDDPWSCDPAAWRNDFFFDEFSIDNPQLTVLS